MTCEPYRAEIPELTCICRQHIIATLSHHKSTWRNAGPGSIIHDACKKCRKGKALYAKAKTHGNLPELTARRPKPANKGKVDFIAYQAESACVGW